LIVGLRGKHSAAAEWPQSAPAIKRQSLGMARLSLLKPELKAAAIGIRDDRKAYVVWSHKPCFLEPIQNCCAWRYFLKNELGMLIYLTYKLRFLAHFCLVSPALATF
jgi:hypothetical protein